jgi:hypothetical protein
MRVSRTLLAATLSLIGAMPLAAYGQSVPAAVTPAAGAAVAATPTTAPAKSVAASLGVSVYPSKGQTADVQTADEAECFTWAKGNTGIDPAAATPPAQPAPSTGTGGTRLKSAAKGAVAGTAIGAVAGDTGQGAAIGATAGALQGGSKARKGKAQAQQQATAQAQAEKDKLVATFNKAFSTCLEGKGYAAK